LRVCHIASIADVKQVEIVENTPYFSHKNLQTDSLAREFHKATCNEGG